MRIKALVVAAAIVLLPLQAAAQNICFPDIPTLDPWAPVVVDKQQYAAWLREPAVWRKLRRESEQFPIFALTQSGFKVPFEGVCNAACAQKEEDDRDLRTIRNACRAVYKSEYCFKWFIPTKREFEWTGRFVAKSLGVDTKLTIRGKEQNGSFDILMEQGCTSDDDPVCVQNFVYGNKFYTVTHDWPEIEGVSNILGTCFASTNSVTVDDLNFLLASARFVGTEEVDRKKMDHFRATCIGRTVVNVDGVNICQRLSAFSDLYVPPGRGYRTGKRATRNRNPTGKPFYKWLQTGDGVGLDPQQDEWFLIDSERRRAGPIDLPDACNNGAVQVLQQPCKNLLYLQ